MPRKQRKSPQQTFEVSQKDLESYYSKYLPGFAPGGAYRTQPYRSSAMYATTGGRLAGFMDRVARGVGNAVKPKPPRPGVNKRDYQKTTITNNTNQDQYYDFDDGSVETKNVAMAEGINGALGMDAYLTDLQQVKGADGNPVFSKSYWNRDTGEVDYLNPDPNARTEADIANQRISDVQGTHMNLNNGVVESYYDGTQNVAYNSNAPLTPPPVTGGTTVTTSQSDPVVPQGSSAQEQRNNTYNTFCEQNPDQCPERKYGGDLPKAKEGWFDDALNYTQTALSTAGLTPGLGIIPDIANTLISGARVTGDYISGSDPTKNLTSLALNAGSMIPGLGQAAGVASIANDTKNYATKATSVPQNTTGQSPLITENYRNYTQPNMLRRGGGLPRFQGHIGSNATDWDIIGGGSYEEEEEDNNQQQPIIPFQPNDPANEVTGLKPQSVDWGMGDEPSSNMQEPSFNYQLYQMSNDPANNTVPGGSEKIDGPQVPNLLSSPSDQQGPSPEGTIDQDVSWGDTFGQQVRNKFNYGKDKVLDSKVVRGSSGAADLAVEGAGIFNDWFGDRQAEARKIQGISGTTTNEMAGVKSADADGLYGNYDQNTGKLRPDDGIVSHFAKRGLEMYQDKGEFSQQPEHDTALLRQFLQMSEPTFQFSQKAIEDQKKSLGYMKNGGQVLDLDEGLIQELIAAGADIKIL